MKKAGEYSKSMIIQYKNMLESWLIDSIYDMLSEEESNVEIDIKVNASTRFTYLELDWTEKGNLNGITVDVEYLEDDGCLYTSHCEIEKLDFAELYYLWKGLND